MYKITIPATSANIGSGFDSLGLAVQLYNIVWMQEDEDIKITSNDNTEVPLNEENLIYSTAQNLFSLCGKTLKGLHIIQENNIPMTRGLGSSSACIVAGLLGANALMGSPLSKDDIVHYAAQMEGHPDNSTPALLGGLVTSVLFEKKVYYVKQKIETDIRLAALVPDFELSTKTARAVLPSTVPHADAVYNLSRSALMSVSIYTGSYQNLKVASDDRLHQPYRMELIPRGKDVFDAVYKAGAYAAYISGAGPTIMAMFDKNDDSFKDRIMEELTKKNLDHFRPYIFDFDNNGATIELMN